MKTILAGALTLISATPAFAGGPIFGIAAQGAPAPEIGSGVSAFVVIGIVFVFGLLRSRKH